MANKTKYWIYHIPGVKIGVTDDLTRRAQQYKLESLEVLEEHTNLKIVSEREIALQKEYNYPVDKKEYWKVIKMVKHRKIDYKARTANIDYSKYTLSHWHTPEAIARRVANIGYKTRTEKLKKPINQYDLEGNFIKRWDSAAAAAKSLNKPSNNLTDCCKGKLKTAYKFIWKYAN